MYALLWVFWMINVQQVYYRQPKIIGDDGFII